MNAIIIADEQPTIIEVNGRQYVEDVRGRLVQIAQYRDLQPKAGKVEINGQLHVQDAEGKWTDWRIIKPKDQLQDELVRKIISYALDLSGQIERFRKHTENDLGSFMDLLAQEYGVTVGGKGGNMTLRSYDDLMRVEVKVGKFMEFGPELQIAKELIDDCFRDWTEDANMNLKTIVLGAFQVDKRGKLDRQRILDLKKYEITDDRWQQAMRAISDADRTVMVREYLHFKYRSSHKDEFKAITINLAKAGA